MQSSRASAASRTAEWLRPALCVLLWLATSACETRERPARAPAYDATVGALLEARCAECHLGADAAAGWSVGSYLDVIGCDARGVPVTRPSAGAADAGAASDAGVPLLAALDDTIHAGLLSAAERETLAEWLARGAPKSEGALHPAGWLDPRSPSWHGAAARADGFLLLRNPKLQGSCGRCHAGAPSREPGLAAPPERAPDCTGCHDAPGGVLACRTCHGHDASGAPPRAGCFFDDAGSAGAHAAHLLGGALGRSLVCADCHPVPDRSRVLHGAHADGVLDVKLDPRLAGDDADYDADTGRCAAACHARGGARERPAWSEIGPLGCGDCHQSPPADHYAGSCDACHPGVNADGSALLDPARHLDGEVSLGDGSGGCGGCHGTAQSPWPATGAHAAHAHSTLSAPVACESCHRVPQDVLDDGHLDRSPGAELSFSGSARARGSDPAYDAASGTCSEVACHGAALSEPPPAWPRWRDADPGSARCGSCHGVGPGAPHTQESGCESVICHGAEVARWPDGPRITESGRELHINGAIDVHEP